ncbi:MAG TPA: AMP-binding protein [Hyphomicrobiaceae bacterium]|jgi:crotonobetaine/carnitine-CoA ligase|nr:AMP-binding protein [Hyphomicrobiaceae bacterium]
MRPEAAVAQLRAPFPDTDAGFVGLFDSQARATPQRSFAILGGEALSFAALDRTSRALGAWLRAKGLGPGDRVALMLRNGETALSLMLALARTGSIWVPINTQAVGDGLAYVLGHAEPSLIIADSDQLPALSACGVAAAARAIAVEDAAREAARAPASEALMVVPPADAPFAIMYTSGTTGRPKGVLVSHRMLRLSGEAAALVADPSPGDVLYLWEPLFHIGGAQMLVLPLIRDVTLAIAERFSARGFWTDVQGKGASHIHFLGGILQILLKQPPGPLDRGHGVRIAWGGGCPVDVWQAFQDRFGVEIRECYGMTECSSVTTANLDAPIGSVGKPVPWFDVAVLDAAGRPVAPGVRGEMVVTERLGGALTRGYFKDGDATARAFRAQAFLTGDLVSYDSDGNYYFHGRMTDSVRVRGENVTALEVESVARTHPAVEDCAMIGVAAEVGEAEIKLFVTLRQGVELEPQELSAWLADRLPRYQRPRYITVLDAFERTPSARIMKHALSRRTDDCWDLAAVGI